MDILPCLQKWEVMIMAMWDPYCYIHKGDFKRGIDTDNIVKTDNSYAPITKNRSGA